MARKTSFTSSRHPFIGMHRARRIAPPATKDINYNGSRQDTAALPFLEAMELWRSPPEDIQIVIGLDRCGACVRSNTTSRRLSYCLRDIRTISSCKKLADIVVVASFLLVQKKHF